MKKVIFVLILALSTIILNAQRTYFAETINTPTGTDTIWFKMFYDPDPWSVQFNFNHLDSVRTGAAADLYCYCVADPDSIGYPLIWVDLDLDGSNDNPWDLSNVLNPDSSLTHLIWGENWPCRWIGFKLERDSVSSGLPLIYWITKR